MKNNMNLWIAIKWEGAFSQVLHQFALSFILSNIFLFFFFFKIFIYLFILTSLLEYNCFTPLF